MTFNEALFILRHGSAEGLQKYLQAVQTIENEVKVLQERNERLHTEKEEMHIDLIAAEEYAMKLKTENDNVRKEMSKKYKDAIESYNISMSEYMQSEIFDRTHIVRGSVITVGGYDILVESYGETIFGTFVIRGREIKKDGDA